MTGIFFHVACMGGHWQQITAEILEEFQRSGLYAACDEFNIGVIGTADNFAALQSTYPELSKIKWRYEGNDFKEYEFPTLIKLAEYCRLNPGAKVFYCHTKGASKPFHNPYWKYWRRYMLNSCVTQYKKHIASLNDHDISGNMWTDDKHYSGNFWWANAAHINQLPGLQDLKINPVIVWHGHTAAENLRLQCEMWIGMKPGIKLKEHGVLNMKPGFSMQVVGKTDVVECPLNDLNFDRIYLVNLDNRPDRYAQATAEINKIGLRNVIRFPAINARQLGITKKTLDNPGLIGCFLSHFFIIQEAVVNNYQRILILEDDVTFVNGFNEILQYALTQLPSDWELAYLGYTERNGITTYKKRLSETIAVPNDPWGTQAYMIQKQGIRIMYENLKEIRDHIDLQMSRHICPQLKAYEFFPSLCPQSTSYSDIKVGNIQFATANRRNRKVILNPH